MDTFELIRTRRSIRKFTDEPVPDDIVNKIIEAGTWAPSGLNNQPWKFAVVLGANVLIAVFLDNSLSYDRTKDAQAIGACIQNMLLFIHSLGLGAVWLGQILKNKDKVLELLDGPGEYELMAVIALGHPAKKGGKGSRKELNQTVFLRK
jgi:nitroreductase